MDSLVRNNRWSDEVIYDCIVDLVARGVSTINEVCEILGAVGVYPTRCRQRIVSLIHAGEIQLGPNFMLEIPEGYDHNGARNKIGTTKNATSRSGG